MPVFHLLSTIVPQFSARLNAVKTILKDKIDDLSFEQTAQTALVSVYTCSYKDGCQSKYELLSWSPTTKTYRLNADSPLVQTYGQNADFLLCLDELVALCAMFPELSMSSTDYFVMDRATDHEPLNVARDESMCSLSELLTVSEANVMEYFRFKSCAISQNPASSETMRCIATHKAISTKQIAGYGDSSAQSLYLMTKSVTTSASGHEPTYTVRINKAHPIFQRNMMDSVMNDGLRKLAKKLLAAYVAYHQFEL